MDDEDADIVRGSSGHRHVHEPAASNGGRQATGASINGLLVAHLVPEPVGGEHEQLAVVVSKVHGRRLRVRQHPWLEVRVADAPRDRQRPPHPPRPAAVPQHQPAGERLDPLPLLPPRRPVVRGQREGGRPSAAQHGAAVPGAGHDELAAVAEQQRRHAARAASVCRGGGGGELLVRAEVRAPHRGLDGLRAFACVEELVGDDAGHVVGGELGGGLPAVAVEDGEERGVGVAS